MAGRTYAVILNSKGVLQDFENLAPDVQRAAMRAVNRAADWSRTRSAKAVRAQINVPASYLAPSNGRLVVKTKARPGGEPEAVISAQARRTSLARFDPNGRAGKRGAMVQVKPGVARFLRNAVFIKLRSGSETDTSHNLGLAVRTKGNKKPSTAYKPIQMRNGMWLLYGPSVAQTLISARDTGIWSDITPEILDRLLDEFYRQLDLKNA